MLHVNTTTTNRSIAKTVGVSLATVRCVIKLKKETRFIPLSHTGNYGRKRKTRRAYAFLLRESKKKTLPR